MSRLGRALGGIGAAGLAAGAVAIALTVSSDHVEGRWQSAGLVAFVGWSFIGTGLFAWWRRSEQRSGALMVAVGFAWFVTSLTASDTPLVFTLGAALGSVYIVICAHMLLAFPTGRLPTPGQRRLLAGAYLLALVGPLQLLMLGDISTLDCDCPASAIRVADADGLATVLDVATNVVAVAVILAVARLLLLRRRRAATPVQRRAFTPVLFSGLGLILGFGGVLGAETFGLSDVSSVLHLIALVAFGSVPYAFLVGLLRSRVTRAGAVTDLLGALRDELGSGDLRDMLARAVGDASLELVYRLDHDGTVDGEGHAARLPDPDDPRRAATDVEHDGVLVGAIVHDRSLCEEPELLRSVTAAAGLAMENGRLQAELRARVAELSASRARLIEAGTAERRRLERNLHDGAQQRLVALSLNLRLAQARLPSDPAAAERLLAISQDELALALSELRELARGIHPAVLSDRGLEAALEALAARSPVPVELAVLDASRLGEPVEAAAYFLVAEALTNVAKYAHASRATVRVSHADHTAVVEVSDDGIGGAEPSNGTGLRGLSDRVEALDGHLTVESPVGRGTYLRAAIPCEPAKVPG